MSRFNEVMVGMTESDAEMVLFRGVDWRLEMGPRWRSGFDEHDATRKERY